MDRTLVLLKPDAVQRSLVGDIIGRFERKGLQLAGMKLMWMTGEMASVHYGEHAGKPFYESLVHFITSGPIIAMVWQGPGAVSVVRNIMGATDPQKAQPGTVRGDLAIFTGNNLVHGSDSPGSAAREIELFFKPEELHSYDLAISGWLKGE